MPADGSTGPAPAPPGPPSPTNRILRLQTILFFLLFLLYLWLEVDLRLVHHGGPGILGFPVFFKGWEFFTQCLSRPGGFLEYLTAFLAQFFHDSFAGAVTATLQAFLVSLGTAAILKDLNAYRLPAVRFTGPILLILGYTGYRYHFHVAMKVLAILILFWLFLRIFPPSGTALLPGFLLFHLGAYLSTGGGHLLFVVLAAIRELWHGRRAGVLLAFLTSGAILPLLVGIHGYGLAAADAVGYALFAPLEPHVYGGFAWTLRYWSLIYLFLPLVALAGRLGRGGPISPSSPLLRAGALLAPFALGAAAAYLFRDGDHKAELAIGYQASRKNWSEVLRIAERLREKDRYPNPGVLHVIDRALYHTGRLGEDLFRYPQSPDWLLLTDEAFPEIYVSWYRHDTFLDLGQVNLAEYHLNHCAEYFGPRPWILRRLALVHLIKGDLNTARVYLGALANTLFDGGWAVRYLDLLKNDPELRTDPEVRSLRRRRPERDQPIHPTRYEDRHGFGDMERLLMDLIDQDPENRMAVEYLLSLCLLNRRLDRFGQHLPLLSAAGGTRLPALYEEAVLTPTVTGRPPLESHPFQISAAARDRAEGFRRVFDLFLQDSDPRLLTDFRGTFLHYFFVCPPTP